MRIALVTNFLYPDRLGGTELYCYRLAGALIKAGHEVFWFVPNFSEQITVTSISENGVQVVRFAAIENETGSVENFVAVSFIREMLVREIFVAHFNEFGGIAGINWDMVTRSKKEGIRSIISLHLPHYLCQTGTLRYAGATVCDGKVIPNRCGSCIRFTEATSSTQVNYKLALASKKVFDLVDKYSIPVFPKIKQMMAKFKNRLPFIEVLKEDVDVIVTLTNWFKGVLMINGIREEKIIYLPQATADAVDLKDLPDKKDRKGYVFIGRINKEKGIGLLLNLAKKLARLEPGIFIDVYGPVHTLNKFAEDFIRNIEKLSNIRYKGVLKPIEVMPVMALYKAILLPSLFTEMAPLIIMEANKLKVPVIASDVPGSSELVKQYDCGMIFKYNDAADLAEKIISIEKGLPAFEFRQPFQNDFNDIALKYLEIYSDTVNMNR